MARTLKSDKLLLWPTILLAGLSPVMVYSASAKQALDRYDVPSYFLVRQLVWAVLGFGLLLVAMRVDYHKYRRPVLIWSVIGIVVASLVAVFLFHPRNGAQRWLAFGPITWQPSELAKLAVVLFTAAFLEQRMHRIQEPRYALLPIGLVTLAIAALILKEPDFGTASVLVMIVVAIVFAAGLSYRHLLGAIVALIPAGIALVLLSPYRRGRLMTFLDPFRDPQGAGFQTIQTRIAVGSGGTFGKGVMAGVQKLFYIPEPHTDFIYAVIAEELGLIGTTLVLLCFALIAWRGLRASLLAPDRFGSLLALGLTLMVALQAVVNISVVVGLLPTKGIPLPLMSSGGSSLVINLLAMGILLNVSQQASPTVAAAR